MIQNESNTVEKKMKGNGRHMEWLESILPFMKAAVQAEMAVDAQARKESNPTSPDSTRKLLRFCSFDFSSVNSPIDMVVGSNEQLEHSIDALEVVVREIEWQSTRSTTNSSARAKLLLVLYAMTTASEGKAIREACAKVSLFSHYSLYFFPISYSSFGLIRLPLDFSIDSLTAYMYNIINDRQCRMITVDLGLRRDSSRHRSFTELN